MQGLDLVPEAVVVVDAQRMITLVNDRALPLLGIGPDSVGHPLADVLALHDLSGAPCMSGLIPDALVERISEQVMRVHLVDGRKRPVAVAGRRGPDGSWALTFRSAGRRERVDVARADVVATVSHEIRSPLTSVKGFTKTMLRRWDRFTDEQKRNMLETINEDADRVTRLLTELLDVSRIDANRVQLHRQMVDVSRIAGKVGDAALARHEGRIVSFDGWADGEVVGEPVRAYADPDKLTQCLTNIVENALRYAPDSDVELVVWSEGDHARVSVRDEGPGIAEDQSRRIFEKFGRGREVRRAGTGLGLYITRGLARAHGGDVWVDSELGAGSTFHVSIPATLPDHLVT